MAWTPEKRKAKSEHTKRECRAHRYDLAHPYPDKESLQREEAPAICWHQCLMDDLLKDAANVAECDAGPLFDAALVLLVFCLRGTMDVPFIQAMTGISWHEILVMMVRAKLGNLVLDDGKPNLAAIVNEKEPEENYLRATLAMALMLGTFKRTHDDKWCCGDHSEIEPGWAKNFRKAA